MAVEQIALTREHVLEYGVPAAPTQWEAEAPDLAGLSGDERTQLAGLLQPLAATLAEGDD
ncbi:hypothetical protein [Nonomuraea sp. NPDC049725]|uniref:hypothetical protein n=1 Tax=Nonomuraea sp. NPDC049725 TaxID=3154508 RepID=UPI003416AB85